MSLVLLREKLRSLNLSSYRILNSTPKSTSTSFNIHLRHCHFLAITNEHKLKRQTMPLTTRTDVGSCEIVISLNYTTPPTKLSMSVQNLLLGYLFFTYLALCALATKAHLFPCNVYLFISKLSTCHKGDVIYYVVNSNMTFNCYIKQLLAPQKQRTGMELIQHMQLWNCFKGKLKCDVAGKGAVFIRVYNCYLRSIKLFLGNEHLCIYLHTNLM